MCFFHHFVCATSLLLTWIVLLNVAVALPGNHNDSSSCSSGPESPNVQDHSGRTQYVSATCVVVTHYSGDVASVVDEHFTRALNFNDKTSKGKFAKLIIEVFNCCKMFQHANLNYENCFKRNSSWRFAVALSSTVGFAFELFTDYRYY